MGGGEGGKGRVGSLLIDFPKMILENVECVRFM